jgi:hypothetical protein
MTENYDDLNDAQLIKCLRSPALGGEIERIAALGDHITRGERRLLELFDEGADQEPRPADEDADLHRDLIGEVDPLLRPWFCDDVVDPCWDERCRTFAAEMGALSIDMLSAIRSAIKNASQPIPF